MLFYPLVSRAVKLDSDSMQGTQPYQSSVTIGNLFLESNLFLSPLAGYTTLPFRLLVREIGGVGLCTTDLVNARSLLEKNRKALKLVETRPQDTPLAVQIFGSKPEEMREAAKVIEAGGFAAVDINMGCPVPKVCKVGGGSAMMKDTAATAALVQGVVEAVSIPVTCKMRLGWDASNITAPDLAKALADVGVSAICVHGRTRDQGFAGGVNLEGIRAVVEAVPSLPVIGNGDVTTALAAATMLEQTGCAGVSIGRGAFYNPWIFLEIADWMARGVVRQAPSDEDRFGAMRRHLHLMAEVFGEQAGCLQFRKIAPWFVRMLGPTHEFNRRIHTLVSLTQFEEILEDYKKWRAQFLDADGKLMPRYRPAPAGGVFVGAGEAGSPAAIAVPKGAVDYW